MAQSKEATAKKGPVKEVDNVKVNKDGFEIGKPIEPSAFISFLAKMRQEAK